MGMQGHGFSNSREAKTIPAFTGFNFQKNFNLEDVRADADGFIELTTEAGKIVTFQGVKGEFLHIQGRFTVTANTAIQVQVYGTSNDETLNIVNADDQQVVNADDQPIQT